MSIREDEDLEIENEEVLDVAEEEIVEESDISEESEPETIQDEEEEDVEDRVVTIGDEEPEEEPEAEETPVWVKKVRKINRKQESELKQLRKQIKELTTVKVEPVELGKKPTLASCSYDEDKFEKELTLFDERKRKVEAQAKEAAEAAEIQTKAWKGKQEKYVSLRKEHSFKDYAEVEELVSSTFSTAQQGIIIQGAKDSALLIYALGKNTKKLDELSKITNTVDFAFAVSKLEEKLNVSNKKAPAPEKRISSGKPGGSSGNKDKVLDKLMAEADKTGDRSKVLAYKNKLRKER